MVLFQTRVYNHAEYTRVLLIPTLPYTNQIALFSALHPSLLTSTLFFCVFRCYVYLLLAWHQGLATVLSLLGLSATFAGKVMGTTTAGTGLGATLLPLGASAFAVAMGLNVLELVQLELPSFERGLDFITSLPRNARAYLLGESNNPVAWFARVFRRVFCDAKKLACNASPSSLASSALGRRYLRRSRVTACMRCCKLCDAKVVFALKDVKRFAHTVSANPVTSVASQRKGQTLRP